MMRDYVITNGINYLGRSGDSWCVVGTPNRAEKFTLDKANKCLKNSMPKWMKAYNLKVELLKQDGNIVSVEPEDIDAEIAEIISKMSDDLNKYKLELKSKLLDKVNAQIKYINSAQQDLEHVPEEIDRTGTDLDMYGGYLFYKDFQGVRLHRRRLKNQKEKIETLINLDIEGFINRQTEEIAKKFNKRTYAARVHNDLVGLYKSHGCLCKNKIYTIMINR